jgi:putative CocE/NonD family hydrolase
VGRRHAGSCRILVERGLRVRAGDGVELATDVYRPADRRAPAILFRTPYDRRLLAQHAREFEPIRAAEAGFAVVLQDVRGRGDSGGAYEFLSRDADDGVSTVRWAAGRSWCDGRVAMAGGSYNGIVQLLVAAHRPRSLLAIAPRFCGSPFRIWYPGGVLNAGFVALYAAVVAGWELARREARGEAVDAERERLAALRDSPCALVDALVDEDPWLRRLAPVAADWIRHDALDEYWSRFHVVDRLDPELPGLHVGGWFDACLEPALETYGALNGSGVQHLIIGPWAHGNLHGRFPDRSFGAGASADAADLMGDQLRFFGRYLARHTDPPAPARVFVMGEDRWREYDRWPPGGARPVTYHLRGSGGLTREPPGEEPPDAYVHDPDRPVPTVGGATLLDGMEIGANAGPRDQGPLAGRADVLLYTSAPLAAPLHVVGHMLARLFVETDALAADFVLKLVDVQPGGRALCVCDGVARVTGPGVTALAVALGSTCHVFPAGHRLRLHVASSDVPRFYPNPGTGHRLRDGRPRRRVVARPRLHHDPSRPSSLTLLTLA